MKKLEIRNVLKKYQDEQSLSPEENTLLQEWYASFPEYEELTFSSSSEKERIKNETWLAIFNQMKKNKKNRPFLVSPLTAYISSWRSLAATILLLVILGSILLYVREGTSGAPVAKMLVRTAPSGKKPLHLTLADGSQIWLHPGSTLRYPQRFEGKFRRVYLMNGVAYFSVAHSNKMPFIVIANSGLQTQVLGTTFNIKAFAALPEVEISLITGSVRVSDVNGHIAILRPSQKMTYNRQNRRSVIEETDALKVTEWKEGRLSFQQASFDEVVLTLEDIYDVRFSYDKKQLADFKLNLKCPNHLSIVQVMDILKDLTGVSYRLENKTIYLE